MGHYVSDVHECNRCLHVLGNKMIIFSPWHNPHEIPPETLLHLPPLPDNRESSYVSYIYRALWVFKTLEKLLGSLFGSI